MPPTAGSPTRKMPVYSSRTSRRAVKQIANHKRTFILTRYLTRHTHEEVSPRARLQCRPPRLSMDTQSPEERARLAALLAQLTPAQRLEAASSLGLSPADLAALGVPVDEGDAEGDEEGGGGDDDDGAGAPGVSIRDVRVGGVVRIGSVGGCFHVSARDMTPSPPRCRCGTLLPRASGRAPRLYFFLAPCRLCCFSLRSAAAYPCGSSLSRWRGYPLPTNEVSAGFEQGGL